MSRLIGILLILAGLVLAGFIGIWVMLVGGIIQVLDAVQVDPIDSGTIAWGVVRILFASTAAAIAGYLLAIPGMALLFKE